MSARTWITLGVVLFVLVIVGWITLGVVSAWPWFIIAISSTPLFISLASMAGLSPKPFFYAALVLMLYIAFAISQIMVVTATRWLDVMILGTALTYLAILKFVLQALNARRQQLDQGSS